jgi:hypothetical protein
MNTHTYMNTHIHIQDDRDALGRRLMLSDCEVRGEPFIGCKLSAFAKRAKKLPITCTFQWARVFPNADEATLKGQDKATYIITPEDRYVCVCVCVDACMYACVYLW